jgi:hypothetical protein
MCCCTKKEKPFGQLILFPFVFRERFSSSKELTDTFFIRNVTKTHDKNFAPKEGKEKQRETTKERGEKRFGWFVVRAKKAFCCSASLKSDR